MTHRISDILCDYGSQHAILDRIVEAILDAQVDLLSAPADQWRGILAGSKAIRPALGAATPALEPSAGAAIVTGASAVESVVD